MSTQDLQNRFVAVDVAIHRLSEATEASWQQSNRDTDQYTVWQVYSPTLDTYVEAVSSTPDNLHMTYVCYRFEKDARIHQTQIVKSLTEIIESFNPISASTVVAQDFILGNEVMAY